MERKFVVIQNDEPLTEEEFRGLQRAFQGFYEDTGVSAVLIPKTMNVLNKKEIEDFIKSLKELIK